MRKMLLLILLLTCTEAFGQQIALSSKFTKGKIPLDPTDPFWKGIPGKVIPMVAQVVTTPKLLKPSVPFLMVKSVNNGSDIGFYFEWKDETKNAFIRPNDFRDGVAVMFPIKDNAIALPYMGNVGSRVDILQWKADWQEDVDHGYTDMKELYPNMWIDYYASYSTGADVGNPMSNRKRRSPVEELTAEGFGTLTSQVHQDASGKGVWKDGIWKVVIIRPMITDDADDTQFSRGQNKKICFAVWNGSNKEVGSRKQWAGNWLNFKIE